MEQKILKYFAAAIAVSFLIQASIGFALAQNASTAQDKTAPSDVENVKATAGDASVTLTWDVATDNVAVTGYKVYYGTKSVKLPTDSYELSPQAVEDVVTTTVSNLKNGTAYYFALTAVDAAGNESNSYSLEVNTTPQIGLHQASIEDDHKNPEPKSAESKTDDTVKVVFSEPVALPLENPEKSFSISEKDRTKVTLKVQRAELDPEDEDGKTVVLETEKQTSETEYEVTIDEQVQDHYGNAVVKSKEADKEKHDKASFTGYQNPVEEPAAPADTAPPTVASVSADETTAVTVKFSEAVDAGQNPKNRFSIEKKEGGTSLKLKNVSLSKDGKIAYLTTEAQLKTAYVVKISGIKDAAGNEMDETSTEFEGKGASLKDLVPPEEVSKLVAAVLESENNVVELTWKNSKNTAGDLVDQMLYQSLNHGKKYDKGISIGAEADTAQVKDLKPGRLYTFKVTAKDAVGNESKGSVISIRLPQTGPALPFLLMFSGLAGYLARRKKSKVS